MCYNRHCEIEYDGANLKIHSTKLSGPIVYGDYEEDIDSFFYSARLEFPRMIVNEDDFGYFNYLSDAISDLVEVANYLNTHQFYVDESEINDNYLD